MQIVEISDLAQKTGDNFKARNLMSKFPNDFPADAEQRLFYEELGRAMANWGQVEGQVSAIFSRMMGRTTESYRAANIALNTVLSFDTKLP